MLWLMFCLELCDYIILVHFRLFEHFQFFFFTFACCNWFYTLVFIVVVVSCMSKGGAWWGGGYSVLFAHAWLVVIRVQLTITC